MREYELAGCTGKERFDTYNAAARVQKRRSRKSRDFRSHVVYRCKSCHGYHLGHDKLEERPKKEFERFRAKYQ